MDFYDIEQNTDQWYEMRLGKLTASQFGTVMAHAKKDFGDPAKRYAVQIALGQITGVVPPSGYQNEHMIRGHEQEPIARAQYEVTFDCEVTNGGFFCNDFIGVSPDGLVGDKGVIEIKSVIAAKHFATLKSQSYDKGYKWQLIGNLFYTGSDWIDFVSYCSEFPEGRQLYTYRLHRESVEPEIELMQERFKSFKELVSQTKDEILNATYFGELNENI